MATYEFPIVLQGEGDTPEEAWNQAVEALSSDHGAPPDAVLSEGVLVVTELPLTDTAYAAMNGSKCPFCGSKDMEGGEANFDGDSCTVKVQCNSCGEEWKDYYRLQGYLK